MQVNVLSSLLHSIQSVKSIFRSSRNGERSRPFSAKGATLSQPRPAAWGQVSRLDRRGLKVRFIGYLPAILGQAIALAASPLTPQTPSAIVAAGALQGAASSRKGPSPPELTIGAFRTFDCPFSLIMRAFRRSLGRKAHERKSS